MGVLVFALCCFVLVLVWCAYLSLAMVDHREVKIETGYLQARVTFLENKPEFERLLQKLLDHGGGPGWVVRNPGVCYTPPFQGLGNIYGDPHCAYPAGRTYTSPAAFEKEVVNPQVVRFCERRCAEDKANAAQAAERISYILTGGTRKRRTKKK